MFKDILLPIDLDDEESSVKALKKAVELGIERPRLRNQQAIANLNTLIYVLLNLRAFHRIRNRLRQKGPDPVEQAF